MDAPAARVIALGRMLKLDFGLGVPDLGVLAACGVARLSSLIGELYGLLGRVAPAMV